MPQLKVNNKEIYYEIFSKEESETIVLIHPAGFDHRVWDQIIPMLSASYQVLIYDLPGAGKSTMDETLETEKLADDLVSLLDFLSIEQMHLVGFSMGGFISIFFAKMYPERIKSLTLVGTLAKMSEPGIEFLNKEIKALKENQANSGILQAQKALSLPLQKPAAIITHLEYCLKHDASNILKNITAQTLVISGGNEEHVTPEETARLSNAIPNATSHIIPDAGHFIMLEKPDELTESILENIEAARMNAKKWNIKS